MGALGQPAPRVSPSMNHHRNTHDIRQRNGVASGASARLTCALAGNGAATQAGHWATILEAMADGVVILDADGTLVSANAIFCALLGVDARPDLFSLAPSEQRRLLAPRDERGEPISEEGLPFGRVLHGEVLTGTSAVDVMLPRWMGVTSWSAPAAHRSAMRMGALPEES